MNLELVKGLLTVVVGGLIIALSVLIIVKFTSARSSDLRNPEDASLDRLQQTGDFRL